MADIRDAVVHVQELAAALSGMKEAPSDPRSAALSYPFAMSYSIRGTLDAGPAGTSKGIHTIATDMIMPRDPDLGLAIKTLSAYIDDFAAAVLADPTLGRHVGSTVSGNDGPPLTYSLIQQQYNGVPVICLRWELRVKIENTL